MEGATSSLADELLALVNHSNLCRVGRVIDDLPPPVAEGVNKALWLRSEQTGRFLISSAQFARKLRANGLDVSPTTIKVHRRNECACAQNLAA